MKGVRRARVGLLAAAIAGASATGAAAQEAAREPPGAKPVDPAPASSSKAEEPPKTPGVKVTAGAEGFTLQSESGDFTLHLRGLVQLDGRFYPSDEARLATDAFLLRRARPIMSGAVGRYFEFSLTPDFGGGTASIQDAYFEVKVNTAAHFRLGKFKPPIGVEHLQSDAVLPFVERALPANIAPNRDVGIQLSGELGRGVVAYAVGVFDGAPDGATVDNDVNDAKDVVGRVFISPFKSGKSKLRGLGFGLSGTKGRQSGPLPSYRSGGQIAVFSYVAGATAEGDRSRVSPELSFYAGPLGVLAEYARSTTGVKKAGASVRTEIEARAWQATASVFITGDAAGFGGAKLKKPFDPAKRHWGGLQLAARINRLEVAPEAFALGLSDLSKSARRAQAWGLGLNWYLNAHLKQMLSFERTSFTGGGPGGTDRPVEKALFLRSQLSF
jgi:phosphate-selective porin OprO and OprP